MITTIEQAKCLAKAVELFLVGALSNEAKTSTFTLYLLENTKLRKAEIKKIGKEK